MNHTQTPSAKTNHVEALNSAREVMLNLTEQLVKIDTIFKAICNTPCDEPYEFDQVKELAKVGIYLTANWIDTADVQRERLENAFNQAWDDQVAETSTDFEALSPILTDQQKDTLLKLAAAFADGGRIRQEKDSELFKVPEKDHGNACCGRVAQ